MPISKIRVEERSAAIAVFLFFSTPSLKIIIPSSSVNVVVVFVLLLHMLAFGKRPTTMVVAALSCLVITLLFSALISHSLPVGVVFQLAYTIVSLILIAHVALSINAVRLLLILLLIWGVFIAVIFMAVGIFTATHLQFALPVGTALISALVILFTILSKRKRAMTLLCFIFLAYTLFQLGSRAIIIGSVLICIVLICKRLSLRSLVMTGVTVVAVVREMYLSKFIEIPYALRYRLHRLIFSFSDEPRYQLYAHWLDVAFSGLPFGYGYANSRQVGELGYAHNLLIDAVLSGGVGLFLVLLFIHAMAIAVYLRWILAKSMRDGPNILMFGLLSVMLLYLFQWQLSFDITTMYLPIGLVFITLTVIRKLCHGNPPEN